MNRILLSVALLVIALSLPVGILMGLKSFSLSTQVSDYWACEYGFGLNVSANQCQVRDNPLTESIAYYLHMPKALLHHPIKLVSEMSGVELGKVYNCAALLLIIILGIATALYTSEQPNWPKLQVVLLAIALYAAAAWFMNGRMLVAYMGLVLLFIVAAMPWVGWRTMVTGVVAVLFCAVSSGGLLVGVVMLLLIMFTARSISRALLIPLALGAILLILAVIKLWVYYTQSEGPVILELLRHGGLSTTVLTVLIPIMLILAALGIMFRRQIAAMVVTWQIHRLGILVCAFLAPLGGGVASMLLPCLIAECCTQYGGRMDATMRRRMQSGPRV